MADNPPQPDPRYIIAALQEENETLNQNKLYLIAVLRQLQQEFRDAQAMWELERESLKAT
jgi:hypothetical protein